jgi:hypothetical protein
MKRIHSSFAYGELEISGQFYLSGPQKVDDVPKAVRDIMEAHEDITIVAIQREGGSAVYRRMASDSQAGGKNG